MEFAQALTNLRKTGIEYIDDIPWGTHICGFYQTKNDLISMLVPYLRAGLENNEYCIWVTSDPISLEEAQIILESFIPNYNTYLRREQLEILSHKEWYIKYGEFDGLEVYNSWIEKTKTAKIKGYEGIRVCGNTTWLTKRYWKSFMDYEAKLNDQIINFRMNALCTYQLDKCSIHEVYDIVSSHKFAFIRCQNNWHSDNIPRFDRLNIISQMASSVAHEIRNPLTTVKGFLQLLKEKDQCIIFKDYFNIMIEELNRANDIISEYLSLARNKEANFKKENINNLLKAIFPLLESDAVKNNNEVILRLGQVDDVLIDVNDMRQITLNLFRNGLEAMGPGGTMTLKTYTEGNEVIFSVQDQGCGISNKILDKIGTPFITTKETGTGLGLAACYSIANRNNATIDFETGKSGTTFYVRFKIKN